MQVTVTVESAGRCWAAAREQRVRGGDRRIGRQTNVLDDPFAASLPEFEIVMVSSSIRRAAAPHR